MTSVIPSRRKGVNYGSFKTYCNDFVQENRDALICLLIFYVVAKTFLTCCYSGFANYDDSLYVSGNKHVTSGLTFENVLWAFRSTTVANWHPLTMLSHMLDCEMYGSHAWGHHATNVVLHALNCALLFLLLERLTGAVWRSVAVALLFGLHPLRVESVAWISERKDVLSTFFWMLAVLTYAKYAAEIWAAGWKAARRYYIFTLLWFLLGLMSKPMLVTFPYVLVLLDIWPLKRWSWNKEVFMRLLKEKMPFFGFSGMFSTITCLAQNEAIYPTNAMPLSVRLLNMPVAYCRYLGKLFCPTDLAVFYPYPIHWPVINVVASTLLLLVLSAGAVILCRRYPYLLVGWLWFLGTLLPVIGLVQVGSQSMADRYSYVPSIGILIIFVWGSFEIARYLGVSVHTLAIAVFGLAVTCVSLTRVQISYWSDGERLWRHAAVATKNNYVAYGLLGLLEVQRKHYAAGVTNLEESLRVRWDQANIRTALGVALRETGRVEEAITNLYDVVSVEQTNVLARKELALALIAKGRRAEALTNLVFALKIQPENLQVTEALRELTNSAPP